MNGILICFVIGVTLFHQLQSLPGLGWLSVMLLTPFLWRYRQLRPLAALIAGAAWSLLYASHALQQQLPPGLEGCDLILEGVIDSLPMEQDRLKRFRMRVVSLRDGEDNPVELSHVQLSWYGVRHTLRIGDAWRLKVRLKGPRGTRNPAGFDHERWLFVQRIDAKGYVREWSGNRPIEQNLVPSWIGRIRQEIARGIDHYTSSAHGAALLKALAVGDKRSIDRDAWQVFTRTGTNHLIAISGLHIGIVAGWLLYLGGWLWRHSERLCLGWPALKAGAVIALIGATGYAALAGFTLPTQRALLMLVTTLGALMLGYRVQFGRSLILALFLVVLVDPLAPLSAGFWLSFIAVAVILWSIGGRQGSLPGWRQGVRVQIYVSVGLLPVLYLFFSQASMISPVVNLLMVPWFSLVLVPLTLIGIPVLLFPGLAQVWFAWLGTLAETTFQSLDWFSAHNIALSVLPEYDVWLWLAALIGSMLILLPIGIPGRWMGVWFCLPVLLTTPQRPDEGEFWFTLLDVGQGMASVIETRNHLLVYDTGPKSGMGRDAAESIIIPYIRSRGHDHIDLLLVSNGDRDHAGGLNSLQQAVPIREILAGEAEEIELARACQAGEQWSWDGVTFHLLHPPEGAHYRKSNDRSCVLQIRSGDWKILLPGDIEQEGEKQLLKQDHDRLKSQIVVAPHHGSKSSSTPGFVSAVDPQWVLFSTGYKNSYGFPKSEVVQRWRSLGAKTLNTAQTGAIEFRIGPGKKNLAPRLYRELNARYWHQRIVQE
jgi:competence protein ComEC